MPANGVSRLEVATDEQDLGALRRENARPREKNALLTKAPIYLLMSTIISRLAGRV